jgi:hypothetical protein
MTAVHNRADSVPGLACLPLRDQNKKKRKIIEENMSPDPLFFAMIKRPVSRGVIIYERIGVQIYELVRRQGELLPKNWTGGISAF